MAQAGNVGSQAIAGIGAFLAAAIGLAALAVILSKSSQTKDVLTSAGSAVATIIKAAVSPLGMSAGSSGSGDPLSGASGILGGVSGVLGGVGGILGGNGGGGIGDLLGGSDSSII